MRGCSTVILVFFLFQSLTRVSPGFSYVVSRENSKFRILCRKIAETSLFVAFGHIVLVTSRG